MHLRLFLSCNEPARRKLRLPIRNPNILSLLKETPHVQASSREVGCNSKIPQTNSRRATKCCNHMRRFNPRCLIFTHKRKYVKTSNSFMSNEGKHVKEHPFPQRPSQAFHCRPTPICSLPKNLVAMISITQFLPPGTYYSLTNSLSCTRLFEVMIMHCTTDGTLYVCCSTVIFITNILTSVLL